MARGWSAQRAFSSVSHAISKPAQRRLGRWQILRIVIISSVTSLRCAQTSLHHSLFPWVRVQFVKRIKSKFMEKMEEANTSKAFEVSAFSCFLPRN